MKRDLRVNLLEECYAMVKHLSSEGKTLPKSANSILGISEEECCESENSDIDVLSLHNELSKIIAPARPKSIWLLYKESKQKTYWRFLGPVTLVRRLMFTALLSLVCFIGISLSNQINPTNIENGIYNSSGFAILMVLMFYLTSAALGASFSNLFLANRYIVRNVFDPKYESSYWIRFVLGVIAGIMLAVIIPVPQMEDGSVGHMAVASRPVLAMLGGFSASLVYRILFRLVYAVESIFVGKAEDIAEEKISQLQMSHEIQRETERHKMANELYTLKSEIIETGNIDEIREKVQEKIDSILS